MHQKKFLIIFLFILLIILLSGCTELFSSNDKTTRYKDTNAKISYDITYGVKINCTGTGRHEIIYSCDTPEVLIGSASISNILNDNYTNLSNQATFNDFKFWNISRNGKCVNYELGMNVTVVSESFNVNDLNGNNALTLDEIAKNHPDKIKNYCKKQSNKTLIFINPDDSDIKTQAEQIKQKADTNNSFIISKELFKWLKTNTEYKTHILKNDVQPAKLTFNKKSGDCDDLTYLYLSLCRSINIPARFIRGFLVDGNIRAVSHAWAEVFVGINKNNGWIPVECAGDNKDENKIETEIHQNFAFESADHLRLFVDDGSNESINLSLTGIKYSSDNKVNFETPVFFADVKNYNVINKKDLEIDDSNIRTLK